MTENPNIVFLTSHDTGDWLGCYGHDTIQTPNLDSLASEGCRFSDSFCTSPVCTPSRGALMTGRYPQSNGLMGLIQTPYRWRLNEGERHLSHILADAGYHTVLFNHQHEAEKDDKLGFEDMRLHDVGAFQLLTGESVSTALETADAFQAFLQGRPSESKPFYAQLGFFETHTAYDWNGAVPDDSQGVHVPSYIVDDERAREHIAALQGSISSLDKAVGRILAALREAGEENNTIFVFTVDHGVQLPRHKWELYDGGIRTALLMRWPNGGISGGKECPWLVSNVDVVPTLLDLAGLSVPENIQGESCAGFFRSGNSSSHRDAVFAMMHGHNRWAESRCVRTANHKLIRNFSPSRQPIPPIKVGGSSRQQERPVVELYNLQADPWEQENLAEKESSRTVRHELEKGLLSWMKAVEDPLLKGPVRTPYYEMAAENFIGVT